jgi:hypothetical protein
MRTRDIVLHARSVGNPERPRESVKLRKQIASASATPIVTLTLTLTATATATGV